MAMAELVPAPFADLVTRLHREPVVNDTLFGLPRRKWWTPAADAPDLAVRFHGHRAGNPLGPAAGPHTQMAQNLLLSYAAGSRILELKTVQVNDRLTIGRPCIDMTNVGYNIEWSQELLVEESIREYVAGMMLIEMLRSGHWPLTTGHYVLDLSAGYDLAGIRSDKMQRFLDSMRDAKPVIAQLRREIPAEFAAARDLNFPPQISDSVTLSTFHGCPADEIERICEFLIAERDLHVIVKMNPPMLGKEKLEHLLHDVLGYTELTVNPKAYTSGLQFDESIALCRRLTGIASSRNRALGFKFSNTLEVMNHRQFFPPGNDVMYMSGQPLHVITMTLTDEFRRAVGPDVPISFSAGIDRQNAAAAMACGFVPITISSDLLRPGGYGRLADYFPAIYSAMAKVGATTIDDFILRTDASNPKSGIENRALEIAAASLRNTAHAAEFARNDPRYRAAANRKVPPRIDSHLVTFDCITCDKCIPVCPNAANFTYPTPIVSFDCHDCLLHPDGRIERGPLRHFEITEPMQIACYADFCNECGNCDTFCPEYGGPYIKKPTFFGTVESYDRAAPRDGFVLLNSGSTIRGRVQGVEYELTIADALHHFRCGSGAANIDPVTHAPIPPSRGHLPERPTATHQVSAAPITLDMHAYHTLRHLRAGVLDARFVNQVNSGLNAVGSRTSPAMGR